MSDTALPLDSSASMGRGASSSGSMYGASRWWVLAAISFALILFLCPFVLAFTNAIRTPEDYGTYGPLAFPRSFDLTALRDFWNNVDFTQKLINSTLISACTAVLAVLISLLNAYAVGIGKVKGNRWMLTILLVGIMIPHESLVYPIYYLSKSIGLFDTHLAVALAHCLFNIPLAVWILEGFMSGVPRELDETAFVDGYPFWRFFVRIFMPTIAAGVGVACFFCFMFSWVELLLAKTLTSVNAKPIAATMTRTASTSGYELGLLAAAGALTILPGAVVIWFVRNYIAKGFALGRV